MYTADARHGDPPIERTSKVTSSPAPTANSTRAMWLGFALITGVLVGATAGLLSVAGGVSVPLAVAFGGTAFGSATALFLTLVRFATGDRT
jgi:hypothetical protein